MPKAALARTARVYFDLLIAHVISAAASIALFVPRGLLAIVPANPRKHRGLEGAQRVADTVLFGTGVWLSVILRLDP